MSDNKAGAGTGMEYYSFERVLKELQMEEDELKRLVSEGEIRAFRDEDKMKFRKSDIDGLKKGRMTEPTIILPSGEPDDSSEDSEVLLVEEDTSETLLDIDDLEGADSSSTTVPTVQFDEPSSSSSSSSSSETITEELTFEEDSGSYVLESSDDVLLDSSEEMPAVREDSSDGKTFIDSDTGLQTEALDMPVDDGIDLDLQANDPLQLEPTGQEEIEDHELPPARDEEEVVGSTRMVPVAMEVPMHPAMMFLLVAATVILIFSGMVMISIVKEVDGDATGWLTDTLYKVAPAQHLYEKGKSVSDNKLKAHMQKREAWRKKPGSRY